MTLKKESNKSPRRIFKQKTIAMIYDFDGTLSPQAMQEYTVLPAIGISGKKFWAEVKAEQKKENADEILTYMRIMLEHLDKNKKHLEKKDLRALAKSIKYFDGVVEWFTRIEQYIKLKSNGEVKLKNYIISAGNKEILDGITIKKHFSKIFACEYFFNHDNRATFPKVVINDTAKTQFVFRINKGLESNCQSINSHMPDKDRPIPFENMIYFGDGLTDVPCMTLIRKNGGHSIAVYDPKKVQIRTNNPKKKCMDLFDAGRIDFFAEANYSENSELNILVEKIIDSVISQIKIKAKQFDYARIVEDYMNKKD